MRFGHNNRMITRSTNRTVFLLLSLHLGLASHALPAQEKGKGFSVLEVSATGLEGEVRILAKMDLILSDPVAEAVNNGIPVIIVKQYAVPRSRLVVKRRRVKTERTYELRKHALSDRYIVTNNGTEAVKTYPSVTTAIRAIGAASVVNLQLQKDEYSDPPQVGVRVYLDIYALPTALRMRAFISRSWRHNSGWTLWNIER
jgi:hypothetical protein